MEINSLFKGGLSVEIGSLPKRGLLIEIGSLLEGGLSPKESFSPKERLLLGLDFSDLIISVISNYEFSH